MFESCLFDNSLFSVVFSRDPNLSDSLSLAQLLSPQFIRQQKVVVFFPATVLLYAGETSGRGVARPRPESHRERGEEARPVLLQGSGQCPGRAGLKMPLKGPGIQNPTESQVKKLVQSSCKVQVSLQGVQD
jgi:hypothetical protein